MFSIRKIPYYLGSKGMLRWMPDEMYLKMVFRSMLGYKLNLNDPQLFCEKIQWLKLHDKNPMYIQLADKYAVKLYLAELIGDDYIVPTLGVWNSFDEIDFSLLPSQFVLKCTHDSGSVFIVKNKQEMNVDILRKKMERALNHNYFWDGREWPYKNITPRILAEEYLEDIQGGELRDYKIYCFHGIPLFCQVISDRQTNKTIDFFDMNWNYQRFTGLSVPFVDHGIPDIPVPFNFSKMKDIAKRLSENSLFLRVDFYEVKGKLYFGEITFYPASGFGEFDPKEWNKKLGKLLSI